MAILTDILFTDFDNKNKPIPTEKNYMAIADKLGVFYDESSDNIYLPMDFNLWSRAGWEKPGEISPWQDNDTQQCVSLLIGSGLPKFVSKGKIDDAVVRSALANRRNLHKEHIRRVEWDGTQRAETLFIDALGAADTPYTREVTKIFLTALVARVYEPGCKFDSMVILVGTQGIGKSTLLHNLTAPYFSDSVSMSDMRDCKLVYERGGHAMLIEFGELKGIKKAEIESLKGFLSSRVDNFRAAFGKHNKSRARTFICAGTTNVEECEGFLRDLTGNRRYLIIPCAAENIKKSVFDIDEEYYAQVLAEAYSLYKAGQKLYISDAEILADAEKIQRQYLETSDHTMVESYLDLVLPGDFFKRDLRRTGDRLHNNGRLSPRDEVVRLLMNDTNSICDGCVDGTFVRNVVTNEEIFRECFGEADIKYNQIESRKITAIMLKLGWIKVDRQKRVGNKKSNFYWRRPGTTTETTTIQPPKKQTDNKAKKADTTAQKIEKSDYNGKTREEFEHDHPGYIVDTNKEKCSEKINSLDGNRGGPECLSIDDFEDTAQFDL